MCNQHVTNHSSDHTVRVILKETTKHNIHWPLDEDIPTPNWIGSFSQTSTRKSALTWNPIIRTSTANWPIPALRWRFYGKNTAVSATKAAARRTWVHSLAINTADGLALPRQPCAFSISREMQSRLTGPEILSRYMSWLLAHRVQPICL